jgi:hypothetical protein
MVLTPYYYVSKYLNFIFDGYSDETPPCLENIVLSRIMLKVYVRESII